VTASARRLGRAAAGVGPAGPARIVHFGPGAFFRAHQAWYTGRAGDGWGIAAVTGRSDALVADLGGQDGLYTLLARGRDGDDPSLVTSISEVVGHADPAVSDRLASPDVAVVTMTVTEAGYRAGSTVLTRLVAGLDARRRAGAGPLALVSCDNLADNGRVLQAALLGAVPSGADGAALRGWMEQHCAFPNTVVDRITPAPLPEDRDEVQRITGFEDRAAVVAEPWSEWIIEDAFPAGRPAWEQAGAVVAADVAPYEQRKLRLLNAGHSLLAYLGGRSGFRFVHEAVVDPACRTALQALWEENRRWMDPAAAEGSAEYCAAVTERWNNPRLPHALAQIGTDGSLKLRERAAPSVLAARAGGGEPAANALLLGAWVAHVRAAGEGLRDQQAARLAPAGEGSPATASRQLLTVVDPRLASDAWIVEAVADVVERLEGGAI